MKKIAILLSALAIIIACNNDSKDDKTTTSTEEKKDASTDLSQNPDYQKGLELIAKSDCLTCHKIDERVPNQGPHYREVANKYAGMGDSAVNYLADKIIKGGAGVWGETLMPPHAAISDDDAKAMVRYILLLKQ